MTYTSECTKAHSFINLRCSNVAFCVCLSYVIECDEKFDSVHPLLCVTTVLQHMCWRFPAAGSSVPG